MSKEEVKKTEMCISCGKKKKMKYFKHCYDCIGTTKQKDE